MAHFLTIFKSLLNWHLVIEAFLDLPGTLSARISALSAALCFHVKLSTLPHATYFAISPARMSVPGGQFLSVFLTVVSLAPTTMPVKEFPVNIW